MPEMPSAADIVPATGLNSQEPVYAITVNQAHETISDPHDWKVD
jgi:hypothetical protein